MFQKLLENQQSCFGQLEKANAKAISELRTEYVSGYSELKEILSNSPKSRRVVAEGAPRSSLSSQRQTRPSCWLRVIWCGRGSAKSLHSVKLPTRGGLFRPFTRNLKVLVFIFLVLTRSLANSRFPVHLGRSAGSVVVFVLQVCFRFFLHAHRLFHLRLGVLNDYYTQ